MHSVCPADSVYCEVIISPCRQIFHSAPCGLSHTLTRRVTQIAGLHAYNFLDFWPKRSSLSWYEPLQFRDKMASIAGKWDLIKDPSGNEKKGLCMNIYPMGPCAVSACALSLATRPRATNPAPCESLGCVPLLTAVWRCANLSCSASAAASTTRNRWTSVAARARARCTSPSAAATASSPQISAHRS